jgi:hypothetical protein
MTYSKRFNCNPYYPRDDYAAWLAEHSVTIHAIRDAGMYGNRLVHYSSPTLTNDEVRIGSGYESTSAGCHSVSFNSSDAAA